MDYTSQSGPTYLGNIISAADNEAIYDENVKLILADKSVLSWILRRCTNEFASENLDTILGRIQISNDSGNRRKECPNVQRQCSHR